MNVARCNIGKLNSSKYNHQSSPYSIEIHDLVVGGGGGGEGDILFVLSWLTFHISFKAPHQLSRH